MMKLPELHKSKLFWVSFFLLGGIAAMIALIIGIQRNNEIAMAKQMYVCNENLRVRYFLTLKSQYSSIDYENYIQIVRNEKNNIDFEYGSIDRNELVYATNFLEDSTIARILIIRPKASKQRSYRSEHFIWIGYLHETPCK